jgi:serine phosphatase RsbU (regulator of sigma subunit)/tetratricopeptide (TPR) repeat protein
MKHLGLFILSCLLIGRLSAQTSFSDSLAAVVASMRADSNKVVKMGVLVESYWRTGQYELAIKTCNEMRKLSQQIKYSKGSASALTHLGIIYYRKGNYALALENSYSALSIYEKHPDLYGQALALNSIGNVYASEREFSAAHKFYEQALSIREKTGNVSEISTSLNNIGNLYYQEQKYEKALDYLQRALKMKEQANDRRNMATVFNSIGYVYKDLKQYAIAIDYCKRAYAIAEEFGENRSSVYALNGIAQCQIKQRNLVEAEKTLSKAREISQMMGIQAEMAQNYLLYSQLDSARGNFKTAYQWHKRYTVMRDSAYSREKTEQMARMRAAYETDRKDKELSQQRSELSNKKFQQYAAIGALAIVLLAAAGLGYGLKQKQEANRLLEWQKQEIAAKHKQLQQVNDELGATNNKLKNTLDTVERQRVALESQRDEITQQKYIIEQKNLRITESIMSAKHIQGAILPTENQIARLVGEGNYFVMNRPRDIVSGDFFVFEEWQGKLFIAAVDCTGHGVPGALMSMVGSALFDRMIKVRGMQDPAEILTMINQELRLLLRQKETMENSGMDVCFTVVERMDNTTTRVTFAGAGRPLYYVTPDGGFQEIKGSRTHIGGLQRRGEVRSFDRHDLLVPRGTLLYLVTDGFIDQNNEQRDRLGSLKLMEMLKLYSVLTMAEQCEALSMELARFQGAAEQRDDILMLGVRV